MIGFKVVNLDLLLQVKSEEQIRTILNDFESPLNPDIENFLKTGDAYELKDGGIIYKDKVCILLGSEVETSEKGRNGKCGSAHNICFFPYLKDIKGFSNELSHHLKNITLSTQRTDL